MTMHTENTGGVLQTSGFLLLEAGKQTKLSFNSLPRGGRWSMYVTWSLWRKIEVLPTALPFAGSDLSPVVFTTPTAHLGRRDRAKPCTTPYQIQQASPPYISWGSPERA
jgi:hypothetical protein